MLIVFSLTDHDDVKLDLSGEMTYSAAAPDTPSSSKHSSNKASQFLQTKGYGWLLEVEEADDDDNTPLLWVIETWFGGNKNLLELICFP